MLMQPSILPTQIMIPYIAAHTLHAPIHATVCCGLSLHTPSPTRPRRRARRRPRRSTRSRCRGRSDPRPSRRRPRRTTFAPAPPPPPPPPPPPTILKTCIFRSSRRPGWMAGVIPGQRESERGCDRRVPARGLHPSQRACMIHASHASSGPVYPSAQTGGEGWGGHPRGSCRRP